jgi:beta-glucanase (GH16 family)
MMPEDSVYGIWPKSGEIDIAELRGNDPATYAGGRDTASSALHWGVDLSSDRFLQTTNSHTIKRSDYSKGFHTYGLEWSETYLYTYIDNRLSQVLSVGFGKYDMWTRSGLEKLFPGQNPWSGTGRYNTPFDQDFYLILNVAVGGTGGYFGFVALRPGSYYC